jgi:hypothetical protein
MKAELKLPKKYFLGCTLEELFWFYQNSTIILIACFIWNYLKKIFLGK